MIPFKVASEQAVALPKIEKTQASVCPVACMDQIAIATSSIPLKTPKTTSVISAPTSKEFYIPFGSGQSSANGYTDVPGIQAYIDTTQYSSLKTVTFEAAIHIPTGNEFAQARLYNVTAQHPVWNSDVYISGGTPQLLVSQPITLDSGNNLYQVQMTTQLQSPAILDSARVHILTN